MLPRLSLLLAAVGHLAASFAADVVPRSTLTEVTDFGTNPTNTKMFLYVPRNLAPSPAIVVGLHWCSGNAQAFYSGTAWARYAEEYGFIAIYPSTPYLDSNCWDVSSPKALTRGGGGNTDSIANMVKFVTREYSADTSRVFVTGTSSGAMMTNVMANVYPDMFAAGIAHAGVPAGCFYSAAGQEAGWNSTCAQGQVTTTGDHWAAIARAMYPGYDGPRPRMQLYHGDRDDVLFPQNYHESIKQYAALMGYPSTPVQTVPNTPRSPYTKYVYGPGLEGYLGTGVGHNIDRFDESDRLWFGITAPVVAPTTTAPSTPATTTTRVTTTSAPGPISTPGIGQQRWGQCGGIGWNGVKVCQSPWTCTFVNDWYSQCL